MAKQVQRLRQQMKITPQQMMLMRLLQVPVQALEQSINEEVERNPLLEVDEPVAESIDVASQGADGVDDEVADFFGSDEGFFVGGGDSTEWNVAGDTSMEDDLLEQLSMKDLDDRQLVILDQIVGSLSASGYLSRSLDLIENELAFRQGIECEEGEMERMLAVVQSLEPAGVGARSLQECLLLQLKRMKPRTFESRCATEVVEHCFDLLGRNNRGAILERLEIDAEALDGAIDLIRRLNPKPCGSGNSSQQDAQTVMPDFVVTIRDGHLLCRVNESYTPKLRVSGHYTKMLEEMSRQKNPTAAERESIDFIKSKAESAQEFIESVGLRKEALAETMNLVAKIQRKYFASGDPADLKPLTQKEVAELVGVDETVMSRIVNQKYVQTDFGTLLLKELFVHNSTSNAEGDDVTSEEVKRLLGEMVAAEDKKNPLTDAQIEARFKEQGIVLARRTISKYRDLMGIPVGRLRKSLKSLILLLMMTAGTLMAQQPKSYYDSLIYMQQNPQQAATKRAGGQPEKGKAVMRKNVDKIDTALLRGDDLIDKMYDSERPLPSMMWYGTKFSSSRVRLETITMDSLPDEVNLRLLKGDEQFCFPVKNVRTSPYGWRWERPHRGVDIALNMGDEVHCAFDGVVRIAKPMGAYGNLVVVRHFNGLETVYGHLSKIKVKPMQEVKAGTVLGLGGSTGRSTGPHLHFEVRFQYEPFDPEWILDFSNYSLRTKRLHLDKTYFGISKPRGRQSLAYKADKSFVKEEAVAKVKPKELFYTVKKGDKLTDIATRYKTTVDRIKELNPDFEKMRPGLKLRVR